MINEKKKTKTINPEKYNLMIGDYQHQIEVRL